MVQNITNAVLNFCFISLPEEIIWILLILNFLKRFDLLDRYMWRENYKWILLPAFLSSISINIFIYIIPNLILKFFISITVLYFSINYVLIKTDPIEEKIKWYKIIISIILSMVMITISEMIYIPIMLQYFSQPIELLNNNMLLKFIVSLPAKTFQILLIYFMYKKHSQSEKYISNILKDRILSLITISFTGLILFALACVVKIVISSEMISKYSIQNQMIISVLITIIPTILISLYIIPINYLLSKIFKIQQSYQQMYDDIDEN